VELPDVITTRNRGETAEEKRARKASVKEMKKVATPITLVLMMLMEGAKL